MLKKALACLVLVAACQVNVAQAADDSLPPQCSNLISLGKSLIWKGCAASGHLSKDPRGKGVALIAKKGVSLRTDTCMRIYTQDGTQVGAMYLYPYNNPKAYAWRGYSNYVGGCGSGDTNRKIRQRSDDEAIYIRTRSRSKTCIKINRSWSNINSTQSCPRS